jgi:ribosomal protein S18 acetylase RimI-like enzyme
MRTGDLAAVAALVADQQRDPARHIGYLASTEDSIAEQLTHLEPAGLAGVVVAVDGRDVLGMLAAEWDTYPPRVWWHGPVVTPGCDWQTTAVALDTASRRLLPAAVLEEEYAPDARHTELAAFAAAHGFVEEEGSVVLRRSLPAAPVRSPASGVTLRPFAEPDRGAVATLHEACFSGTHTPGARLDEGRDRLVWVADSDGQLVGYVALQRQEDGDGYLDYLAVVPAHRGRGLGRILVATACDLLHTELGCHEAHLTVRASNAAARAVYAGCGFTEERVLVPWRRGFSLR